MAMKWPSQWGNHPSIDFMVVSPTQMISFGIDVKGLYKPNFWAVKAKPIKPKLFSFSLDFSNSICLWRRMKPATAVFSGNKGKFDRVAALWFEVRGLRVQWRAASRDASPGGRAPSLGAAERHLVFARACGSGGVEGPPQIQISHFEFDLVRAA